MKLNIYFSNSIDNCTKRVFSEIVPNSSEHDYVILTPDRRTLLTEQELFDQTKALAFFNVNVTTFTRFTNELLQKLGHNNKKLLKKPSAVAIIKKIMLEQQDQLTAFKKSAKYSGVASKIFDTISMFKSCNVAPNEIISNTKSNALNNKIKDIALIYEEYEKYLQTEYTDSFNKLTLLSTLLNTQKFENTHFIFLGFDDFTPQQNEIITKLIKVSKSVSVSCTANFKANENKNLFLNNIYLNMIDIAKILGIVPNIIECVGEYNETLSELSKYLFSYSVPVLNKEKPKNLRLIKFNSKENEIEFVGKYILNALVNDGLKYSDFTIVAPSLSNYDTLISQEFNKLSIPYFIDQNQKFSDHVMVRFIEKLTKSINSNFKAQDVVALLKHVPTLEEKEIFSYESFIITTGLRGTKILKPLNNYNVVLENNAQNVYEFLASVLEFYNDINEENSVQHFVVKLKDFLNKIGFENFENYYINLAKNLDNLHFYKTTIQVLEKLNSALSEIENLLGNYVCNFENFASILDTYLENINLSLPPLEHDTVFVADSVSSYINTKKVLIFLGANEGELPVQYDDLGIISDSEINLLSEYKKLSPTISYINKRNKFLLYEKLLKSSSQLLITMLSVNEKNETLEPSSFVLDILKMYNVSNIEIGEFLLNKSGVYLPLNENKVNDFLFNNINIKTATDTLINSLKDWYYYNENTAYIAQLGTIYCALSQKNVGTATYVNNLTFKNTYDKIDNAKQLFFVNNSTSVSQFESFFTCPFKHFIEYGLKLQEVIDGEFDARDFGIILHDFVAKIMPIIATEKHTLTVEKLTSVSNHIFDEVLENENVQILVNNPKNINAINSLRQESLRISKVLLYEQQNSEFTPKYFETYFGKNENESVVIETENGKVLLKGVVDRIDEWQDKFRIIDYKTGKSEFNNYTEVVSGKKLQLFVYLKATQNKTKKHCVGAFYLPLRNDFTDKGSFEELYKLKGVIANELSVIFAMDKNLNQPSAKSKIINLKTNADGSLSKAGSKLLLSESDIEWLADYSVTLIKEAFEKIISGDITPNPLKLINTKNYEQESLIALNNFNLLYGNKFRRVKTVSNFDKQNIVFELNLFKNNNEKIYTTEFTLIDKE